jgi:vanillate O-demethylase ferredoxin subunit
MISDRSPGQADPAWLDVVVAQRAQEAEGILSFLLRAADGGPLPPFEAGAHVDVALPNGAVRQYSLCGDPAERDAYRLGILLEPAGRGGSRNAHEALMVGTGLRIRQPRNLFGLQPARHTLLFAGGIGITPMLAMATQLTREDRAFDLHYCARSAGRMAFRQRLADAPFAARVHLHLDDGPAAQRFDPQALPGPGADERAYVCGPRGFMDAVIGALKAKGWPDERIHFESFSAPASDPAAGGFEVQLGHGGAVVPVSAGQSVAEALRQAGLAVSLSCEQGICGTCALRVLDGVPDHRDMYFSDDEKAANDRFTPCCSRSHSPRLVIEPLPSA